MVKSYYKRFGLVLNHPLWPKYLRWAYRQGLIDVKALGANPNFNKPEFACLLCGCGNEQTADTFIEFVTSQNRSAKIYIIDLGSEQIIAIKKMVAQKYKKSDVTVHQINALDLEKMIPADSIDWIETDGFIEYFNHQQLEKLLNVWHRLLRKDGFITTRDCITEGLLTRTADCLRVNIGRLWLGVELFPHTRTEFESLFSEIGFRYRFANTWLYTYRRLALIKKNGDPTRI